MTTLRQLGFIVIGGVVLGAIVAFFSAGSGDDEQATLAEIDGGPTADQLVKEIDKLRIDGIRFISEGKHGEAVDVFLRLVDINHHDPFAYQRMAGMMAELGHEKFEKILHERIKGKPIALDLNRILGAVYFHANKPEPATRYIEAFLVERPNDLCATYYKGALARKSGDNNNAVQLLTYVINEEETYYYAYLELQQAYDEMGQTDLANKMLGLALKNSPKNKDGICCGLPNKSKKKKEDTSA